MITKCLIWNGCIVCFLAIIVRFGEAILSSSSKVGSVGFSVGVQVGDPYSLITSLSTKQSLAVKNQCRGDLFFNDRRKALSQRNHFTGLHTSVSSTQQFAFQAKQEEGSVTTTQSSHGKGNEGRSISSSSSPTTTTTSPTKQPPYIIREATMRDLGPASTILTDGFFAKSTNFFTYKIEKLKTYLSLEACFPKEPKLHKYYVACSMNSKKKNFMDLPSSATTAATEPSSYDKIIGFVEIDCRPLTQKTKNAKSTTKRPYMCNLAIDQSMQRKGIATALIRECESLAIQNSKESMWLKVRAGNMAAVKMYTKAGYKIDSSEQITEENHDGTKETMLLMMMKELNE